MARVQGSIVEYSRGSVHDPPPNPEREADCVVKPAKGIIMAAGPYWKGQLMMCRRTKH